MFQVLDHAAVVYTGELSQTTQYIIEHYGKKLDEAIRSGIKIAYTDPLSGPFAQVGDANMKQLQYIIDFVNSKGGALGRKFELVPFEP